MSTPSPCASCLAADLPSVVSKSKKRKLRERNLAIRKAVENIQSLLDAAPFICKQSSEGDVSTPVQPTVNLEECLRALVLKVDAILDAVMPLVNSRHDHTENRVMEALGHEDARAYFGDISCASWSPLHTNIFEAPECVSAAELENQCRAVAVIQNFVRSDRFKRSRKGSATVSGNNETLNDVEGVVERLVDVGEETVLTSTSSISNPANNGACAESDNLAKPVLCRGPGHVRACDRCFFTDDRFGRHHRCRRDCANVSGQWGPTICCAECKPVGEVKDTSIGSAETHGQTIVKSNPKRIWKKRG